MTRYCPSCGARQVVGADEALTQARYQARRAADLLIQALQTLNGEGARRELIRDALGTLSVVNNPERSR